MVITSYTGKETDTFQKLVNHNES